MRGWGRLELVIFFTKNLYNFFVAVVVVFLYNFFFGGVGGGGARVNFLYKESKSK